MAPQVNGDSTPTSASAFFSHLFSYPLISDSITTIKRNPYAAKSLSLTTSSYETISAPLAPYLQKPYQYVSPYISKADSIGDSTLSSLDSRFPVVKKPTGELYENAQALVGFPLKKGVEGKEYVWSTYQGEVKKVGAGKETGLVGYGKAALGTGLIVAGDSWNWLGSFLSQKKAEGKEVVNEKTG